MGQGFYMQPNISYSQSSKIAPDQIQSRQVENGNSSEDDILESRTCNAQVYISEVNNSSNDEDQIITL